MTNPIDSLSGANLRAVFNQFAAKPVNRFATDQIGRTRLAKLLTEAGVSAYDAITATGQAQVIATLDAADAAKAAKPAAKKAAKPAKPAGKAKPAAPAAKAPGGAKATILAMIAAKGGTTERDVAKALGWPRAGGTISRAIAAAPFAVVKTKGEDGRTVYSRA